MSGQMRGLGAPLVKLVAFALVTIMAAYVLITTITNAGYGEQLTYRAQFTDVAGLVEGDEVRIAGVRVGQVVGIGLAEETDRPVAEVELEVGESVPLPSSVEATIRFRNLVGQRYVALTEGEGAGGGTLESGAVIPLAQTTNALDLTILFGGFQPLLQALSPEDVNRVSFEIIQVFQGEGGTVESLLGHVGSLTNSLADRDQVIGSVIDNLTTVMGTLATIDQLATATSGFLEDARAPLTADIRALDDLSRNLGDTGDVVERFLQTVPAKLDLTTRTAINGSWFNFFLCRAGGTVTLPATPLGGAPVNQTFEFESGAEGCS